MKTFRKIEVIVLKHAEVTDEYGRSEVHHAAADGDIDGLRQVLERGADPDLQDISGMTPLHFSAQEWHPEAVEILLNSGAQVDLQNGDGNTPLFDAVYNSRGRSEVIEILRAHGADPLRENANGMSPVALARLIGNFNVAQYFLDVGQ